MLIVFLLWWIYSLDSGSHDDAGLPPPGLHLQDGGHHLGRLVRPRPGPRLAGHLVGGEVVVVQGLVGRL